MNPNPTSDPHIGAQNMASLAATFYNAIRSQLTGPRADDAALQLTTAYIQTALLVGAQMARAQQSGPTPTLTPAQIAELIRRVQSEIKP